MRTTDERMARVDAMIAKGGRFAPRWGWHDDHRDKDGQPDYLPALQQVRGEFEELVGVLGSHQVPKGAGDIFSGSALQLGLGECEASHAVWMALFDQVVATIDWSACWYQTDRYPGADTHSTGALDFARRLGPYDFLLIDAGHTEADVRADYLAYAPLVRTGGIIAFHDALEREGYPELGVRAFLETLEGVRYIGKEVGIGWVVKP